MTEIKAYTFGLIIGSILTLLIIPVFNTYYQDNADMGNYYALLSKTNQTIEGAWFPYSSFCISMSDNNINTIEEIIDHEYTHELINNNRECGNVSCYKHFCGGY